MTQPLASSTLQSPNKWKSYSAGILNSCALIFVLIVLVLIFSQLNDRFLSLRTAISIANQIPALTIVAVGMTFVLIAGGIDLSVGSVLALCSVVIGVLAIDKEWPLSVALMAAICVGSLCGLTNGIISVQLRIPSFIVTLGMLEIARGATYYVADSKTKYLGSSLEWFGASGSWGISPAFALALSIVLIGQVVLARTILGRYWVTIGTNEMAARYSGIDPRPYRIAAFVILGILCGIGAVMHCSLLSSADPNAAIGLELSAIAAAVIGGTSLMGGRGSVIQTFWGVLVIAVLQTGLSSISASEPMKRMVTGGVIVLAVAADMLRHRRLQSER
ncbi:MAG: ABC transporter permease [Planctomycetaceae bacterium]|nr:ABC transporter permease [Planctomycetaceae bacterium]